MPDGEAFRESDHKAGDHQAPPKMAETNVLREVQGQRLSQASGNDAGLIENSNPNQGVDLATIASHPAQGEYQSDGLRAAKTLDPVIADNISDKVESSHKGQEALIENSKILNIPGKSPEQIAAIETLRTGPEALVTNKSITTAEGERLAGQMVKTPDGRIEFHPDNRSGSYEIHQSQDNKYSLRPIGDNKQAGSPLEIKSISNYRPADEPQPRVADRTSLQNRDNNISSRSEAQIQQPRDRAVSTRTLEPNQPADRSVSSRADSNNIPTRDRSTSSRTESNSNVAPDRSISSRADLNNNIQPDRSTSSRETGGQQGRDNRISSREGGADNKITLPEGKDIGQNPTSSNEQQNVSNRGTRTPAEISPGNREIFTGTSNRNNQQIEQPGGGPPGTRGGGIPIETGAGRNQPTGEGNRVPDVPNIPSNPGGKIIDAGIPGTQTGRGIDIPSGRGPAPGAPPFPQNAPEGVQNTRGGGNTSSRVDGIRNIRDDNNTSTPPNPRIPSDINQGPAPGTGRGQRGQENITPGSPSPFNPTAPTSGPRAESTPHSGQGPGRGQNSPEGRLPSTDNTPANTGNRQAAIDERNAFLNQTRTNQQGNDNINFPPGMQPRRPGEFPAANPEISGRRTEGIPTPGKTGSDTTAGGINTGGGKGNIPGVETLGPSGTPRRPLNSQGGADTSGPGRGNVEPGRPTMEGGLPNTGRGEARQGRAEINRVEATPGDGGRGDFRQGERGVRATDSISLAPALRLDQPRDGAITIGKGTLDLRDVKTREALAEVITKLQTGKLETTGTNAPRLQELIRGLGTENTNQLKALLLTGDHKGAIRLDNKFDTSNQTKVLEILRILSEGKGIKGSEGLDVRLPSARMADMFTRGDIKTERLPTVDQQKALISELVHGLRHLNHEMNTANLPSALTLKDLIARGIGEKNTAAEKIFSSIDHQVNISNLRIGERGQQFALQIEGLTRTRTDTRPEARPDTRLEIHVENAVRDVAMRLQSKDFSLTQDIAARKAEQQSSSIKTQDHAHTSPTGIMSGNLGSTARVDPTAPGPREVIAGKDTGGGKQEAARGGEIASPPAGRQIDSTSGGTSSRTDSALSSSNREGSHDTSHPSTLPDHKQVEEERIRKEREEKIKEQKEEQEERLDAGKAMLAALKLKEMKEREEKEQQEKQNKAKKKKDDEKRITYVTRQGDTLEGIASRMLRDRNLGVLIYELNKSAIPVKLINNKEVPDLKAGLKIAIPNAADIRSFKARLIAETPASESNFTSAEEELKARFGDNWKDNEKDEAGGISLEEMRQDSIKSQQARRANIESLLGPVSGKSDDPKTHQEYLVRLGDTLKSIAARHPGLQDVHLWQLLAQVNNLSLDTDIKGNPLTQLKRGITLIIPNAEDIRTFKEENIVSTRKTSTLGKTGEISIDKEQIKEARWEEKESGNSISAEQKQPGKEQEQLNTEEENSPTEFNSMQLSKNARLRWAGTEGDYNSGVFLTLQAQADQKWLPVVHYEIYSDRSFRHEYRPDGTYSTREIILGSFSALKAAENELKNGWLTYSNRFLSQLL